MTTHPAPDPFVFDPARIHKEEVTVNGFPYGFLFSYPLPDGATLIHRATGGQEIYNTRGVPPLAYRLFELFQAKVAGLSAHQKLAWAAAAHKEVADA